MGNYPITIEVRDGFVVARFPTIGLEIEFTVEEATAFAEKLITEARKLEVQNGQQ